MKPSDVLPPSTDAATRHARIGGPIPWAHLNPPDTVDVSVCIANWNCREQLRECLTSLCDFPQDVRVEVIVVDNASVDGAPEMVANEFPEVVLVRNDRNLGFARASNQAAERANGRYLFFLNNDTVVPAFALRTLVDYAKAHPNVGMVGPRLRDPKGNLQISCRRKPSLSAMLHRTALLRWTRLFKRDYDEYRRNHFDSDRERNVEILMGAAVLVPRNVYKQCGGWDEDFRFGVEDVEYSVRIGRQFDLVYLPAVEILHHGRLSSRANAAFAVPNLMIGYVHYFRKDGASPLSLFTYKAILSLDIPLRFMVKSLQYVGRKIIGRHKDAERNRLAARGLWHFLRRDFIRFWRA